MEARILRIILFIAVLIRLAVLAAAWNAPDRLETPDSRGYVELSETLVGEGSFTRENQAEIFRTPGYPLFLTAGRILGASWWRAAVIVQMVLGVLVVYLTFILGRMLCDRLVGLWAAGFQAVALVSIAASFRILSDSLFAFMLISAVLLIVHHLRTLKWWSLLCGAVVAGLGCYVRPVGLVFCVLVVIVLIFRRVAITRRLGFAGALAGVVVALVVPWVVRNHLAADYAGFSSFAGDSMYFFSAPKVLAEVEGLDVAVARRQMRQEDQIRQEASERGRSPGQAARWRARRTREIILGHPGIYARVHLLGSSAVFLPGVTDLLEVLGVTSGQRGTLDILHREGVIAAVRHYFSGKIWALLVCVPAVIVLLVKYAFVLVCVIGKIRWKMDIGVWLIVLTVMGFVLVGGPAATPRFRVPIEPLLSLGGAVGVVTLAGWIKRRKPKTG